MKSETDDLTIIEAYKIAFIHDTLARANSHPLINSFGTNISGSLTKINGFAVMKKVGRSGMAQRCDPSETNP